VHVVPAGVHDGDRLSLGIDPGRLARIWEPRLLLHRERVELGAEQDRGTLAVAQDAHDSRASDAGRHFIPELAQLFRHSSRGALLLHRQLGVLVQIDVERVELGVDLIESVQGRRSENEREEREHAPTYSACLI